MTCLFYTPSVDEAQARAMLAAIESTLSTWALGYRMEPTQGFQAIDAPEAWFASRLAGQASAIVCNGNEEEYVSLMAVVIPPALVAGGGRLIQLVVNFPESPGYLERVPDLVRAFGPAAGAYWGIDISGKSGLAIAEGAGRTLPPPGDSTKPTTHANPAPSTSALPAPLSPAIPDRLGWISYWSEETCRLLAFSPADARASLFGRVTPVEGHGVVLQLTKELLDLGRIAHMAMLTTIYDSFPPITQRWGV